MKIYIVTAGEYSDYRIEKVFTDKAKAEEFAKWCYDSNGIEEWDTEDDINVEKYYKITAQYKMYDNGKLEPPIVSVWNCTNDNHCGAYTYLTDYHRYGGNYIVLTIGRFVNAGDHDADFYKNKYTKVLYDIIAMIKQLHIDGYTYDQIDEMLKKDINVDEVEELI